MKKRILTGITTTGTPHIGNYIGAIRPAIEMTKDSDESFFFLADYHSIIKNQDSDSIKNSVKNVALAWLSSGLDPNKSYFYKQSDVPEIIELCWILNCVTAKGLMNRAHAYKAATSINDEIKRQEDENKEKKILLIKKVAEITNDDNEKNISEFIKLKDEWSNIGPAGKKNEKKMWDEFNKNADRFFVERKQKLTDEINKIGDLNKKLNNDEISISEVKLALNEISDAKNTKEFKNINKDIKSKINDINIAKKKERFVAYANIYEVLLGKIEIDKAPSNFINTIQKSLENDESNIDELNYACVKLEILAGIDSLKKDQSIRNNIQLEMLSNKFNKNNVLNINDMDSLINHFINNFSKNDSKTIHANIWKRIIKCVDKLIS